MGVGALGPVFRTYEPERDRLVAVKVFRLDITPELAQALADELSRAPSAGLFHPSIVEPIAAGVEGSVAFAAEEYVAADTLDALMREYAPAAPETVLPWITQMAGAIDFARAVGVGHGGLHPRDIFVTPEEVRATGFGVVEALDRVGLRPPVRRPYTPPERIAVQSWGTPADVFSLAAITFELLTGRRPAGLGAEIGSLAPAGPNEGLDGIWTVLARAMDADPAQRFQTALAFASALEAAAHADAAPRPVPRPPAPAAVSTAAAGAAAGGEGSGPAGDAADAGADEGEDDILGEQNEDEAHHQLTLHEIDADERRRPLSLLDDESEGEADADRLMMGAAAAAAGAGDRVLDDYDPGRAPAPDPDDERVLSPFDRTPARSAGPWREPAGPGAVRVSQEGTGRKWPVAAVLILGLLGGLLAGYGLWGRTPGALTSPGEAAERELVPEPAAGSVPPQTAEEEAVPAEPPAPVPTPERAAPPPVAAAGEPAAPPPPPASGTIVVRSTPSRAGVTVDGEWKGRTPLTLSDLPLARYAVRVVQPGYVPFERSVSLTPADPSGNVSVRLRRSPEADAAAASPRAAPAGPRRYTGSIYVDSRPRGARVSINGKAVGVTPLRVPEIPIGSHVVRMELPDHRIWSSATRVAAGEEARVTGSLERIR